MFTGIIQAVGDVAAMQSRGGDMRLRIRTGKLPLHDVALGDSVCTNGVCLTVIELPGDGYWADVSVETLNFTTLGDLQPGSAVNLEKALRLADRLGGHLMTGHVDAAGTVLHFEPVGDNRRLVIAVPHDIARYIARKGSVAVNGVSLTVNAVDGDAFEVNLIPHTLSATTLQHLQPGARVNLEVDLLARYAERLLNSDD